LSGVPKKATQYKNGVKMRTNIPTNTLLLMCPEGTNSPALMFGSTNFRELQIVYAPQLGGAIPNQLGYTIDTFGVARILVILHMQVPSQRGCVARAMVKEIENKAILLNSNLQSWLAAHVKSDVYEQATEVAKTLMTQVPSTMELVFAMFDHLAQKLYPIGLRRPKKDILWVHKDTWKNFLKLADIARLNVKLASPEMQRLFGLNDQVAHAASDLAEAHKFIEGPLYHHAVFSLLPYPPEALPELASLMGFMPGTPVPDPYFMVYCANVLLEDDAIYQLELVLEIWLDQCRQGQTVFSKLWVVGKPEEIPVLIERLTLGSQIYRELLENPNWLDGPAITVEAKQPY
jgi:hypothetical protein